MANTKIMNAIKMLIAMLIPCAAVSLFLIVGEGHHAVWEVMPSMNDEDFYYNQVKSVLQYGHPLGYYGYDGSHAVLGNFGAHGWFILLPHIFFSFCMGGLNFCTFAVVNLVMYAIAMMVYVLLYKPRMQDVLWGGLVFFAPMLVFYSATAMMEGELYFWAILSAVLMGKLATAKHPYSQKDVVFALLCITLASLCKVTWSILFFPFFLIIFSTKIRAIFNVLISAMSTVTAASIAYMIYRTFAAEYFPASYFIDRYVIIFQTSGINVRVIKKLFIAFVENVISTFGVYDVMWIEISKWFILIVLILSLIYLWSGNKHSYIPIVILSGFIVGVVGLYSKDEFAIRTLSPAAVFSMMYMVLNPGEKRYIKSAIRGALVFIMVSTLVVQIRYGFEDRYWYSDMDEQKYQEIENRLSVIEIEKDTDPWNNTVAVLIGDYAMLYPNRIVELFLPAGTGINYYSNLPGDMSDFKPKYILVRNDTSEGIEAIAYLEKNDFEVLISDIRGVTLLMADGILHK